jgi:hypothetical protein
MPVLAKHSKSFELINCTEFSANSSVGIHKRNLLKPRVVVATYSDGIAPVDTCSAEHSCGRALPFASLRYSRERKKDWRSRPCFYIVIRYIVQLLELGARYTRNAAHARRRTQGREISFGRNLSGKRAPFRAHHDDDHGDIARRFAAGAGDRHRRRVASPTRADYCWRPHCQPSAHFVHHAGRLLIDGSPAGANGAQAPPDCGYVTRRC